MRTKMIFCLFALLMSSSLSAFADDLSIGQNGDNEFWSNLNNDVAQNGSRALEWQQRWPVEKVRRAPNGAAQADTIVYCLNGQREGVQLLNAINTDSVTYEEKKNGLSGTISDAVESSYGDNERILQSLNSAIKERKTAAKCQ